MASAQSQISWLQRQLSVLGSTAQRCGRSVQPVEQACPRYCLFLLIVGAIRLLPRVTDGRYLDLRGEEQIEEIVVVAGEILQFVDIDLAVESLKAADDLAIGRLVSIEGELRDTIAVEVGFGDRSSTGTAWLGERLAGAGP